MQKHTKDIGLFPGISWLERESDHSLPSSIKVMNELSYITTHTKSRSRDSSAGVSAFYGLEARNLSLLHSVLSGSGAHPVSYSVGTGGCIPEVKRPGLEADHSPPPSDEIKKEGDIRPLPHISSWHSAYLIKHRNIFPFTSFWLSV
jgi:hypothetical protein